MEFTGYMKMFSCTATSTSCNPNSVPCLDCLALISKGAWKVAVAYCKATVLECYIFTWDPILPDLHHFTGQHCKNSWTPCMKIQAIMEFTFPRKRVFPVAVWWIDFYVRQRIANAHITCFQFFYRIIQYQTVHKRRINLLCFFVLLAWWLYKCPTVLNWAFIVVLEINDRSTIMSAFPIFMKQKYVSSLPWVKTHIL